MEALQNIDDPVLLRNLSEGLHALAQPIAIMQATLELASMKEGVLPEQRLALDQSLAEVGRAIELLRYMRELVSVSRGLDELTPVDMAELTWEVADDLRTLMKGSGASLEVEVSRVPAVRISRARLRAALFYVGQAACASASRGDSLSIRLSHSGENVQLNLSTVRGQLTVNGAHNAMHRSLALARATVLARGGAFVQHDSPFSVEVALPIASDSTAVKPWAEAM